MEFLHAIVSMNSTAVGESKDLAVPVVVTTRHSAVDLRWTPSGEAEATYLPMRSLSIVQTQAVRTIPRSCLRVELSVGCDLEIIGRQPP